MKIETIKENSNYQKINKSFIVNRNDDDYKATLVRRQRIAKQLDFENRLLSLENKIDQIFNLLTAGK